MVGNCAEGATKAEQGALANQVLKITPSRLKLR